MPDHSSSHAHPHFLSGCSKPCPLGSSLLPRLSGSVDCSMIILYSTVNIYLWVSTYHVEERVFYWTKSSLFHLDGQAKYRLASAHLHPAFLELLATIDLLWHILGVSGQKFGSLSIHSKAFLHRATSQSINKSINKNRILIHIQKEVKGSTISQPLELEMRFLFKAFYSERALLMRPCNLVSTISSGTSSGLQ